MGILPGTAIFLGFLFQTAIAQSTVTLSPSITASVANASTSVLSSSIPVANATTSQHSSTEVLSITPTKSSTVSPTPSSSPTSTTTPLPTTKPPAPHGNEKKRSFDGASFFGGIVLGIVLAAIFVFGFTWWKNKRKSYHTL